MLGQQPPSVQGAVNDAPEQRQEEREKGSNALSEPTLHCKSTLSRPKDSHLPLSSVKDKVCCETSMCGVCTHLDFPPHLLTSDYLLQCTD